MKGKPFFAAFFDLELKCFYKNLLKLFHLLQLLCALEIFRYYGVEMIRKFSGSDIDPVLDIWLAASIKAHDFVEASFWESQEENMRNIYIPASETYVIESNSKVVGFYSLNENSLAAIFVSPEFQGKGIGRQLMSHAKKQRAKLTLSVYKENDASCQFYFSQGFSVVSEQIDEHTGHQEYTMSICT